MMRHLMRWTALGAGLWLLGGCLPLDQELEAIFAPDAVGNAVLLRQSLLFALLQPFLS